MVLAKLSLYGGRRMEQKQLSGSLDRFKRVLNEQVVNGLGKEIGFCERLRTVTPHRLVVALLAAFSCTQVETLADIHRGLTALFGKSLAYKPFHNQLSKESFPEMMRAIANELMTKLAVRVLRAKRGGLFSEFKGIVIQDGSSFALKDTLRNIFPGRFTTASPAAVEVHVTMDLFEGRAERVTVTADTEGERAHLPKASDLAGKLLLADRGYFSLEYIASMITASASFIIRSKTSINPVILEARTQEGKKLRKLEGKHLKKVKLSKQHPLDLVVEWTKNNESVVCRVVVSWNPKNKQFGFYVTNLPRDRYSVVDILQAYRLRWQIELLFKEWKSYANLHAFDTSKASIAEGLIWAALAAATIKRYLAHTTQVVMDVEISTRKVAMCCVHVLLEVFMALARKSLLRIRRAWKRAISYLAEFAQRSHPTRDRIKGRLALGLKPVLSVS